jgi:prophage regulatory protein
MKGATQANLPAVGYVRMSQLAGAKRKKGDVIGILPISAVTLWRWVKEGRFPKPVKLSAGTVAWRVEDVRAWMADKEGK